MDKSAVVKRIKSLMKKTTENGCSEQEAMAAAQKVAELLDTYQITMSSIEIEEAAYENKTAKQGNARPHMIARYCAGAISKFCNTISTYRGSEYSFFGDAQDVELSFFLLDLLKNTAECDFRSYKKSGNYPSHRNGNSVRADFMKGFGRRCAARLFEMAKEREQKYADYAKKSGTKDLIIIKDAVVHKEFDAYFARKGKKIKDGTAPSFRPRNADSFLAGDSAGSRASLTTGINEKAKQHYLGSN